MANKRGRPPLSSFGAKRQITLRLNPNILDSLEWLSKTLELTRVAIVEDALEDYRLARDEFHLEAEERATERLEALIHAVDRAISTAPDHWYEVRAALHSWRQRRM